MKQIPGPTTPEFKQHDWGGGRGRKGFTGAYIEPMSEGDSSMQCRVCGVQYFPNTTYPDKFSGKTYTYMDAHNVTIISRKELPCPTFVGNVGGAIMDVKGKVQDATKRVGGVEARVESAEERIAALEAENLLLRNQASVTPEEFAGMVAQALLKSGGLQKLLPEYLPQASFTEAEYVEVVSSELDEDVVILKPDF